MITDNTAKWNVRKLTDFGSSAGLPVGFQYFSMNPNIPTGSLPLLGGEYSRTAYADLWGWIQEQPNFLISEEEWQTKFTENEGNVSCYSTGDGSNTFRVPSLSCSVQGAKSAEEVGSYLKAGLPNIEGQFMINAGTEGGVTVSGSFYDPSIIGGGYSAGHSTGAENPAVGFNASLSNPIYGNSDTVQPKAIVGMWLVVAFGTMSNVGNQDLADISVGFASIEANVSSVADRRYITETFADGGNWYRVWSDGYIEQGGRLASTGASLQTIQLLKPHCDTDYCVSTQMMYTESLAQASNSQTIIALTEGSIQLTPTYNAKATIIWSTKGY